MARKFASSASITPATALRGFAQFGIRRFHQLGNLVDQLVQERLADAHLVAVEDGAAQQPADHVALLLVARIDVFVDGERAGADVVGDAPQPAAGFLGRLIADAADLAGRLDQRAEDVDVEVRVDALQHRGRPLQAHARVDVLARQRVQIVGRVADAVELREHQVPNLDRAEGRVEVDFAARAADAVGPLAGGVGRPEVLVLAQPLQAAPAADGFRRARWPPPRRRRDRPWPRAVPGVKPSHFLLGQELPRPMDRLALEIIAEAEVAQHLEEGVVIGRASDVVDVAGAQAFLAGRGPRELQLAAAEEVVLELVHARRSEEHRGVPAGHQHVARAAHGSLWSRKRPGIFHAVRRFSWSVILEL